MKNFSKKTFKNNATLLVTLLAAGSIFTVVAYNGSKGPQAGGAPQKPAQVSSKPAQEIKQTLLKVSVQNTLLGSYQAEVTGFGEAKPRFELNYTSELSGRVNWVAETFEEGVQVAKGDLLATLDDSEYQQLVSQAKSTLATAELELLEEQREGEQAKSEWERSGLTGKPDSPLVFREPQLASALANVENAKKALIKAQKDLAYTEIRAPFDGIIISCDIQPGAHVSIGGAIATLYSTDRIDVEVPLNDVQWSNLPHLNNNDAWTANIYDRTNHNKWDANVARAYNYIDDKTRQRSVVLTVDAPLVGDNKLFAGMFVQAKIQGKALNNIWQLPASALSQQGEVWVVNEHNVLKKYSADVLFARDNNIYLAPVVNTDVTKVAVRPLSNFKEGLKVAPQLIETEGV